ncbi:MAG TPA: long-chain-fatty-acid--CoA ligase [Acidobacteriota bacterium]|nr:long-chain-fatty-acid--CoA ligase [Acidobacteriota bacterium]
MKVPLTPLRFLNRARRQYGSKTGVVEDGRAWTYRHYDRRCRKLARLLKGWDLPAQSPVAFMAYNTHELLEGYYGAPLAEHVLLPLNIRLTADDFAFILNDAGASALFLHADFVDTIAGVRDQLETVERFVVLDRPQDAPRWVEALSYEALLEQSPDDFEFDYMQVDEDSVAEIFYTSGTTGRPKGVMLTHRNLYLHALELALALRVEDTDVLLHTIPLFHVNGWGGPQMLTGLGGTHVMLPKFEPEKVYEAIERYGVTGLSLVPTMAIALVNFKHRDRYDLSTVRQITVGGSASNPHLTREVEDLFDCDCLAGYGLTETSPALTLARPKPHLELSEEQRLDLQSMAGSANLGAEIEVWDDEGNPQPWDGESVGEIVVRGDMVMEGYYNRPEENEEAFRGGWFHTGDSATIDERGYVQIVDRKKDIIISGGENISSIEIENALLGHSAVLECAVVAEPDDEWGEVPRALVVLKEDHEADEAELIDYARRHLAHFKCPRAVDFYDEFPKGGTGKILKRELREKYWSKERKRVH